MRICSIPQAFRGKGLPTLKLLSLHQKKNLCSISASLAKFMHILQIFQLLGKILLLIFCGDFFFLSSQWAVLWIKAITSVWAFKRKNLGRVVSLDLLPWRLGCAGLAALLLPAPWAAPCPAAAGPLAVGRSWRVSFHPLLTTSLYPYFGFSLPQMGHFPLVKNQFIDSLCWKRTAMN